MHQYLGQGSFGRVVLQDRQAIKYFQPGKERTSEELELIDHQHPSYLTALEQWVHEVSLRSVLGNESGLCQTLSLAPSSPYGPYISMELFTSNLLEYSQILEWDDLCSFLLEIALPQIIGQLRAIHTLGFLHGDVKPGNILVKSERVALTDFGASTQLGLSGEVLFTTTHYLHPDAVQCQSIGPGLDYYSLGVAIKDLLYRPESMHIPSKLQEVIDFLLNCNPKLQRREEFKPPHIHITECPSHDRTPFLDRYHPQSRSINNFHEQYGAERIKLTKILYQHAKKRYSKYEPMAILGACLAITFSLQKVSVDCLFEQDYDTDTMIQAFMDIVRDPELTALIRSYIMCYVLELEEKM